MFAISLLASIFRRAMKAGLLEMASPISWALLASPCNVQHYIIEYQNSTSQLDIRIHVIYTEIDTNNTQVDVLHVDLYVVSVTLFNKG